MKRPEIDPRTLEALEACRPGSEDLSDPVMASLVSQMAASRELDDLYERLQKFDASLASAYQDVPVPEGLAERILAHLDASQEGPLATSCTPPLPSSGAMTEALSGVQVPDASLAASLRQVSGRSSQRILRRWLVGGGLVSAAVIVTGIVCWVGLRAGTGRSLPIRPSASSSTSMSAASMSPARCSSNSRPLPIILRATLFRCRRALDGGTFWSSKERELSPMILPRPKEQPQRSTSCAGGQLTCLPPRLRFPS